MRKRIYRILLVLGLAVGLTGGLLLFSGTPLQAAPGEGTGVTKEIIVGIRSSPDAVYTSELRVRSDRWTRSLKKLAPVATKDSPPPFYTDATVTVQDDSSAKVYLLQADGSLTDVSRREQWMPPGRLKKELRRAAVRLRAAHYGKLAPWTQAEQLLPRKGVTTITDLETGLQFQGQRRAGSSHADVQPLTKKDTEIMKEIYGGQWSWNRRAVLVSTPYGQVAASMHGMPHGGDGIPDNGFNGHFCIHFAGSVTHGTGHSDPAHQVMIHKAAGKLESYMKGLSPSETVDLFLIASHQKERHLMSLLVMVGEEKEAILQTWLDPDMRSVRRVSDPDVAAVPKDALEAKIRLQINVWREGSRPRAEWKTVHLRRFSSQSAWQISTLSPPDAGKGTQERHGT